MAEKIFKAEVPDGQHLGRAKGSDGEYRGLLFDEDNNLVGHVGLSEVEDHGDDATDPIDDPWEPSSSEDEVDFDELLERLQVLLDLAILLAAAAEAISVRRNPRPGSYAVPVEVPERECDRRRRIEGRSERGRHVVAKSGAGAGG